jgi:phosphoribosylformylglycinamidine cyclo-ligase
LRSKTPKQLGTDWLEMYKVFNMGHRMEIYLAPEFAQEMIDLSESFGVDAQIIGRCEASDSKKLTIDSQFGTFIY